MTLLDELKAKRSEAREARTTILTRAAGEGRALSDEETAAHDRAAADETEAGDAVESYLIDQVAEVRSRAALAAGEQVLGREDQDIANAFRSAITSRYAEPIEVHSTLPDQWPDSAKDVHGRGRTGRIQIHTRDLLKSTATQALRVTTYDRIVQHLVETSSRHGRRRHGDHHGDG